MLKKVLGLFAMVSIGTAMGVFYVAGKVESVTLSYEIRTVEKRLAEQYDIQKKHRYRLAALKSPSQLAKEMAETKIDLVPVREVRLIKFARPPLGESKAAVLPPSVAPPRPGFLNVREAQAKTDDSR